MKCRMRSFAAAAMFAALPLFTAGTLDARDADPASGAFASAQTAQRQCLNACRARYRDCRHQKQAPSFQCRDVYRDCTRFNCDAPPRG
jgi:hypothetical protein